MVKFGTYLKLLKPYKAKIFLYAFLTVCSCGCNLLQPLFLNRIVDQINALSAGASSIDILITCAFMVGAAALSLAIMLAAVRVSVSVTTAFTADLRAALFDRVCNIPLSDIERIGVTAMLDRSTYDVSGLMDFLAMALNSAIIVPIYITVGCVMAFMTDGYLASIMVVCVPLIVVMIFSVSKIVQPLSKRSNKYLDIQNKIVHERLSGIRVIRAFNREPYEHARMADATNIMADNFVKTNVFMSVMTPIASLVMNVVTLLILYFGAQRITSAAILSTGDIVKLLQYVTMMMNALFSAAFAVMWLPRIRVSVSRMNEILGCPRIARRDVGEKLDGTVIALDASYRYVDSPIDALNPCSFSVKQGERVALIGGTGSGKSTLMTLFTGLALPTGGTLVMGGKSVGDLTVDEISGSVATVFQKSDFFTASLRDNIDPEHKYTDEEIYSALDCAEFGDFVRKVGLDYGITQNAGNLSGGQKQRLALARAFLKDASVYLFDDSFSALDYLTEKRVRKNMSERLAGKTCIIATQRVSTAYNCDKILLFDGGSLIAAGKHADLMNNPIYKEIYISQTGGER